MWVHLINGRSFWFRDTTSTARSKGLLVIFGKGNVLLAHFHLKAVACWFYDNVDVSAYTVSDKLERPELCEVR